VYLQVAAEGAGSFLFAIKMSSVLEVVQDSALVSAIVTVCLLLQTIIEIIGESV
jgi:hypothetical protein